MIFKNTYLNLSKKLHLVIITFLTAEFVAENIFGFSLCLDKSCSTAGELLSFDKKFLIAAAILWLSLLYYFSKNKKHYCAIYVGLLFGGVAFEGGLLGTLLRNQIPCSICLIMALAIGLLLSLLTVCNLKSGLIGFCVWLAAISSSMALTTDIQNFSSADLESSAFAQIESIPGPANYHLFIRFNCSHCRDLLSNLAKKPLKPGTWYLHFPTAYADDTDLRRAKYIHDYEGIKSLFPVLKAKSDKNIGAIDLPLDEKDKYDAKSKNSQKFMNKVNFKGVPSLYLTVGKDVKAYVSGTRNIETFLLGIP